jgi:hypothetical protein
LDIFKNVQNWKAQKSLENASFFTFAPLWSEFYFEGCKFCDNKNLRNFDKIKISTYFSEYGSIGNPQKSPIFL